LFGGDFADNANKLGNLVGLVRPLATIARFRQRAASVFGALASPPQPFKYVAKPLHCGSSARIAGANSIIGRAASHMRSKCASNLAAAPVSRMTTRSLSCLRSPVALKFADPVRKISPSIA
jgi:hypothetical protein